MSRKELVCLAALVALLPGSLLAAEPPKPAQPNYRLSGPYTHGNLTLFLIHGEDQLKGRKILTLEEALEQKKVIVYETRVVNQLLIENISVDCEVFIAAGDIVKGGDQDRILSFDLVIPPQSGKKPLACFCCESGRWARRTGEENRSFSSSRDQIATRTLKLAARAEFSQAQVWKHVAMAQQQLSTNLKIKVQDGKSESSLQLSLENKMLVETVNVYDRKLAPAIQGQKDVIGYAFAINGHLNSIDVYASSELFLKLWPKLLKASCVEAVAELPPGALFLRMDAPPLLVPRPDAEKPGQRGRLVKAAQRLAKAAQARAFPTVTAEQVKAFMADAAKGKMTEKDIGNQLKQIQQETEKAIQFETRIQALPAAPLRRNILAK